MESQLSYLSFHRHVKFMQRIGIYPINRNASNIKKNLHLIYRCIILLMSFMYSSQQLLKIYEKRRDAEKVMEIMCLFITNVNFFYKIMVLKVKYDKVEEVLQITKGPIFNKGEKEHRVPLMRTIRDSLRIISSFNYISLFTAVLWSIRPVLERYQGKEINIQIWLPFDTDVTCYFYICVLYWWIQVSILAAGNSIVDGFIAFLFEQCKTQIKILRLDLKNAVEKSKVAEIETSDSFSNVLEEKLKNIIIHHKEIVKMTNIVQDIFGSSVFNQFLISGWILCTSAYSLVSANTASLQFVQMLFYICCMLIELFMLCYYGNKLTFESNRLVEYAYESDWLEIPVKHRRLLIAFMERIKRPIQPTAGSFIPLSNNTFISIIRSSYTFYAFLKNSN
ncbi:odorant receptor 94b [Plodia interpunctella]|uniref:odorant receptor 94b n=1 Tax=Plodia interpunctella TaxID=58824 RepID=UPI002368C7B0|nr:odorant receptor 94b-like [Plodia interpunctella]